MYPICLLLSKISTNLFTSEESTNTSGYRIDNVSLTGIAK